MKRQWYKDRHGYFRNCRLVMAEFDATSCWRARRRRALLDEHTSMQEGVVRVTKIGWRDVVVEPKPFREQYPDKPELWALDDIPW